jgi:serine protease Do
MRTSDWPGRLVGLFSNGRFMLSLILPLLVLAPNVNARTIVSLGEDDFSTLEEAREIQDRVIQLIDALRPAVVGVEIQFTNDSGRPIGQAGGSGTIIDAKDGIILTAGHVGRASGLDVMIYLHDGTKVSGKTIGQHLDGQEDCGLIKINDDELDQLAEMDFKLLELPLGDSGQVETGDWVLVFGHTHGIERNPWRPPPARIGRITSNHGHVLTMDAPLNSGDSGGPLINLDGELIGINESCAMHPFENAATAVRVAIERLDGMRAGECTGATLPLVKNGLDLMDSMAASRPIVFEPADPSGGRHSGVARGAFVDAVWDASDWTIRVYSDDIQVGLGTVIDSSGLLVTKASELDPREDQIMVVTSSGLFEEASVVGHDPKLDLLLLQLPPGEWIAAPLEESVETEAGSWLVSAGPDAAPISFGIRGLDTYVSDLSMMDGAFFGVRTESPRGGQAGSRIVDVVPGCAARRAGMQRGDLILRVDGNEVRGPRGLVRVLSNFRAGDLVEVEFERDDEMRDVDVRLGSRWSISNTEHETGNMLVPVSRRDTGFGRVIQHDSLVTHEECGGPLVDVDGRFVGINIARSDRTKIFALPADVLLESIRSMRQSNVEKAWSPMDPLLLQIPLVAREGIFNLHAQDAQVFGPSAQFARLGQDDDTGCILHWLTDRDEVLWVIDSPEPGAYEVVLEYACNSDSAGVPFEISTSGSTLKSKVIATAAWDDFEERVVGELEIYEAARTIISVKPIKDPKLGLMNLRSLKLIPIID